MAEKIYFSVDEIDEFIYGGVGYRVVEDTMLDHTRWSIVHRIVICREEDNTFWASHYEEGATEKQDYGPLERWGVSDRTTTAVAFRRVFPAERLITVYLDHPVD